MNLIFRIAICSLIFDSYWMKMRRVIFVGWLESFSHRKTSTNFRSFRGWRGLLQSLRMPNGQMAMHWKTPAAGLSFGSLPCIPRWGSTVQHFFDLAQQGLEESFQVLKPLPLDTHYYNHTQVAQEDQELVLQKPPSNICNVVLATTIAESSLTLPEVIGVIDFCVHKTSIGDPSQMGLCKISAQWCARSACLQREGRAGRTQPGWCIRMVPEKFFRALRDWLETEWDW